jgi:hypothetical protein
MGSFAAGHTLVSEILITAENSKVKRK